jgi:8-oxo-dGTP pyrophosphatase MutT (NUDIX family)
MTTPKRPELKFAPRPIFENILEYGVIPTFDLVIEMPQGGVVLVRRIIPPYENRWALPGLRMFKPESIDDTIARIAEDELGLRVDVDGRRFLGQYVGRFKTEHERQDLSTGYAVRALPEDIRLNRDHFSGHQIIKTWDDVPANTGAMYRFYLSRYFEEQARTDVDIEPTE